MENPFITKSTDAEAVANLVENLDHFMPEGRANTKAIGEQSIKYSRAWLILRRAWLEQHQPSLLVQPTKKAFADAKKFADVDPEWEKRHVWGPLVVELHDGEACSWGEIMVRLGKNEGFVRKAYELQDGRKRTVGLRTGKGGRFAADRPDLYQEHRRAEGAEVPNEKGVYASNVQIEQLLNAERQEA